MKRFLGLSMILLALMGFYPLLSGIQAAPGAGEPLTLAPCAFLPLVERAVPCVGHGASMTLSATPAMPAVGQVVTVTVVLVNDRCVAVGAPEYRLTVETSGTQPILQPENPEPVAHNLVIPPGESDSVDFVLLAIRPGEGAVTAFASFDIQLGRGAPVYRSYSTTGSQVITVTP